MTLLALFSIVVVAGCALTPGPTQSAAARAEHLDAAGDQRITKRFSESGELESVSRYNPNGDLVGTLYYSPGEVPRVAEMFDGDLLAGRIFYYPNGQPEREEHYDAAGTTRRVRTYSDSGEPLVYREYNELGELVRLKDLRGPQAPSNRPVQTDRALRGG